MKKKYINLLAALLVILLSLCPIAVKGISNTGDATYNGIITIANTATSATNVSVPVTGLNVGSLVSNGYLWSNCTNSAILSNGADIAYMPNSAINSTIIFVSSAAANTTSNAQLYVGGNQTMSSKIAYFPDAGGMTVPDNDTFLEPASNFTFEWSGFVSPSSTLISKTGAFSVATNNLNNITATITHATGTLSVSSGVVSVADHLVRVSADGSNFKIFVDNMTAPLGSISQYFTNPETSITLTPDGDGYATGIDNVTGAATHWQAVLTNDGFTSFVNTVNNGFQYDYHTLSAPSFPANTTITHVNVTYIGDTVPALGQGNSGLRLGSTDSLGDAAYLPNGVFEARSQTVSRPGGGSWSTSDINNLQEIIGLNGQGTENASITQAYTTVYYTYLTLASVVGTANNWTYSVGTPYMDYARVYVNGELRGSWAWQDSATFTDLSGNGQDATSTFRTASSNANVAATLASFVPINPATATTFTLISGNSTLLADIPEEIPQMYTELNFTYVPGAEAVNAILDAGEIPWELWWYPLIFFAVCIVGFIVFNATQAGGSQGSLLTMCIAMEVSLIVLGLIGVTPFLVPVIFAIPVGAWLISQKQYSW